MRETNRSNDNKSSQGKMRQDIAPTPLMLIVVVRGGFAELDLAIAAYEPKRLILLPGGMRTPAAERSSSRRPWHERCRTHLQETHQFQ